MRWLTYLLIAASTAALAADREVAHYSGYFMYGFEVSLFRPVGSTERWWLVGSISIPCPLPTRSYIFLEVMGELSPKGKYGHQGLYDRQLGAVDFVSCRQVRNEELRGL